MGLELTQWTLLRSPLWVLMSVRNRGSIKPTAQGMHDFLQQLPKHFLPNYASKKFSSGANPSSFSYSQAYLHSDCLMQGDFHQAQVSHARTGRLHQAYLHIKQEGTRAGNIVDSPDLGVYSIPGAHVQIRGTTHPTCKCKQGGNKWKP